MAKAGGRALVLGAGGIAGAFQAGAISVVLREEQALDAIFGSSAGALNGAFLADRAGRRSGPVRWREVADELVAFWQDRITGPEKIWTARSQVQIASQICTNNFRGMLRTEADPPRMLMRNIIRAEISRSNLLATADKGTIYRPGVVDMFTGEIVYPAPSDEHIVDLIIASTAIPIAMDCVIVPRDTPTAHPFIDGGTRDVAPLSRAIRCGYTQITCIACQPVELKYREFPPRTLSQAMARVMSIVINETVNNDLTTIDTIKGLLARSGLSREQLDEHLKTYFDLKTITVIRPRQEIEVDDMAFDEHDIEAMVKLGVETAKEVLGSPRVFGSLREALDQSEPFGSFTIAWQ